MDAPCSGSGLFRKDNEAIDEWSEQNVQLCSQRQQRILADILPALKDDGILIYSTCSYSKDEDEEIVDWLIKNHQLTTINLQLKKDWNIVEIRSPDSNGYGYRFYPDKIKGEGDNEGDKVLEAEETPTQPPPEAGEETEPEHPLTLH